MTVWKWKSKVKIGSRGRNEKTETAVHSQKANWKLSKI